jgi:hypothetical protein
MDLISSTLIGARRQARTDPLHDFYLLLNGIDIGGARFGGCNGKTAQGPRLGTA